MSRYLTRYAETAIGDALGIDVLIDADRQLSLAGRYIGWVEVVVEGIIILRERLAAAEARVKQLEDTLEKL